MRRNEAPSAVVRRPQPVARVGLLAFPAARTGLPLTAVLAVPTPALPVLVGRLRVAGNPGPTDRMGRRSPGPRTGRRPQRHNSLHPGPPHLDPPRTLTPPAPCPAVGGQTRPPIAGQGLRPRYEARGPTSRDE